MIGSVNRIFILALCFVFLFEAVGCSCSGRSGSGGSQHIDSDGDSEREAACSISGSRIVFDELQTVSNRDDAMRVLDRCIGTMGLTGTAKENFRYDMTDHNTVSTYYLMRQQHEGVDICGASVSVAVEGGACERVINGSVTGDFNDSEADLTEEQAEAKLSDIEDYSFINQIVRCGLIYYPIEENSYRLAYQFIVSAEAAVTPEDGEETPEEATEGVPHGHLDEIVFIDADSGEILSRQSAWEHYSEERTSDTLTDSNGDPLTYFVDVDDEGNDVLYDENTGIVLFDAHGSQQKVYCLYDDGTGYHFEEVTTSTPIDLVDQLFFIDGTNNILNTARSSDENYASYQNMFEAAEKAYEFYENLGWTGHMETEGENAETQTAVGINIIVNSELLRDNAGSHPYIANCFDGAYIVFSPEYTNGFNNGIMYHEYTHSVVSSKHRLNKYDKYYNYIDAAISEAYADILGDIIENDTTWIHYMPDGNLRDGSIPRSYKDSAWVEDPDECHTDCCVIYHCAYLMYHRLVDEFGLTPDEAMAVMGRLWYNSISELKETNNSVNDLLDAVFIAALGLGYGKDEVFMQMIEDCFYAVNIRRDDYSVKIEFKDSEGNEIAAVDSILDGEEELYSDLVPFTAALTPGRHSIMIKKDGYADASLNITVMHSDETYTVTLLTAEEAEPEYKYALFRHGVVSVENAAYAWGLADKKGNLIAGCNYAYCGTPAKNGLIVAMGPIPGFYYGYIDAKGNTVIEPKYRTARDFDASGHAAVQLNSNGRWGVIDETGKLVIDAVYSDIGTFDNYDITWARNEEGKYGYIDVFGNVVIGFDFAYAKEFDACGLAAVRPLGQDVFGFIDMSGHYVIEPIFYNCSPFSIFGIALVRTKGDYSTPAKYNYIDTHGNYISEKWFDYAKSFNSTGYACVGVKVDGRDMKFGVIDTNGNYLIEPQYDDIQWVEPNGLISVLKDGKWGFIDYSGNVVIDFKFKDVSRFSSFGVCRVSDGNLWGFINPDGSYFIEPKFIAVSDFYEDGYAVVLKKEYYMGVIDSTGRFVVEGRILGVRDYTTTYGGFNTPPTAAD